MKSPPVNIITLVFFAAVVQNTKKTFIAVKNTIWLKLSYRKEVGTPLLGPAKGYWCCLVTLNMQQPAVVAGVGRGGSQYMRQ